MKVKNELTSKYFNFKIILNINQKKMIANFHSLGLSVEVFHIHYK